MQIFPNLRFSSDERYLAPKFKYLLVSWSTWFTNCQSTVPPPGGLVRLWLHSIYLMLKFKWHILQFRASLKKGFSKIQIFQKQPKNYTFAKWAFFIDFPTLWCYLSSSRVVFLLCVLTESRYERYVLSLEYSHMWLCFQLITWTEYYWTTVFSTTEYCCHHWSICI